jgi:serine protease Do
VSVLALELGVALAGVAELLRRTTVQVQLGAHGEGSGVLWRADGLVLTNAHVAPAGRARVRISDGRVLEARVVARDPECDLAALLLPPGEFPVAERGSVAALRPGELIVAFGHPLGVPNALSLGVVHRVLRDDTGAPRWIQADLRLAPGNSGGPLADVSGRVLGLNTLVAGGLGYAVPVPVITRFLERAGPPASGRRAA